MARLIAYVGQKFTIAFARAKDGSSPGSEFFESLSVVDKAKLLALFRIAGEQGQFYNPEKFGDLSGGLYEFKSFQIRMPFVYARSKRGLILITHGFIKKRDKTPKEEIVRAWRIYEEDQAQPKLFIVARKRP